MIDTEFTPAHFSLTVYNVVKQVYKLNAETRLDHYSVETHHFSYAQDLMRFAVENNYSEATANQFFFQDKLAALEAAEKLNIEAIKKLESKYLDEQCEIYEIKSNRR